MPKYDHVEHLLQTAGLVTPEPALWEWVVYDPYAKVGHQIYVDARASREFHCHSTKVEALDARDRGILEMYARSEHLRKILTAFAQAGYATRKAFGPQPRLYSSEARFLKRNWQVVHVAYKFMAAGADMADR